MTPTHRFRALVARCAPRRSAAALGAVLALAPLFGCYSASAAPDRSSWTLVAVDWNAAHAANTGVLPTFRRGSATTFAPAPAAFGTLRISEDGKAACEVRFEEPVIGLSGRAAVQRYDVIAFAGRRGDDKNVLVAPYADVTQAAVGTPTELRLEKVSATRVRVHPYTGARPLPYAFTFASDVGVERPVQIPFID